MIESLKKALLTNNMDRLIPVVEQHLEQRVDVNELKIRMETPKEIWEQGYDNVINYWESFNGKEGVNLNEIKVTLIGPADAGKTSLVRRLMEESINTDESMTVGVEVKKYRFPKLNNIQVRFWDFGGQAIVQSTHQFFLTKRCIYIIVLDSRTDKETPEDWLESVKSYGGDSPVFVIRNKIDIKDTDFDRRRLKEDYPNIAGFFKITCEDITKFDSDKQLQLEKNNEFENFKKDLQETIQNNLLWTQDNDLISKNWYTVKDKMELEVENYGTLDQFRQICKENDIKEESQQNTLLDYLNDLGALLHLKELEHLNTLVLNPSWLTGGAYHIITDSEISRNGGIVCPEDLDRVLDSLEKSLKLSYPQEKRKFILEAMRYFQLCYPIENSQNHLIPDLLPTEIPQDFDQVDFEKSVWFYYDFEQYFPPAIMPCFICKMHREIYQDIKWRYGVVLYNQRRKVRAIIRSDERQRLITVQVEASSNVAREYLNTIRNCFESIFGTYQQLNFEEKIPVFNRGKKEFIPYEELLAAEYRGAEKIPIYRLGKEYSVQELLNGIESPESRTKRLQKKKPAEFPHIHVSVNPYLHLENKVENINEIQISIEINQTINETIGDWKALHSKLKKTAPDLAEEMGDVVSELEKLENATPRDISQSSGLSLIRNWLEDVANKESKLHKTLKGAESLWRLAQKIGRGYNKIAEYTGMPQVPRILL